MLKKNSNSDNNKNPPILWKGQGDNVKEILTQYCSADVRFLVDEVPGVFVIPKHYFKPEAPKDERCLIHHLSLSNSHKVGGSQ